MAKPTRTLIDKAELRALENLADLAMAYLVTVLCPHCKKITIDGLLCFYCEKDSSHPVTTENKP